MTLVVQEDGKISEVSGNLDGARWNDYFAKWSPPAQAWMRVNRAEELTQIDPNPDRRQAGALQIKLCRDYEAAVKIQEPATASAAQDLVNAINSNDIDAALVLLTDDAKFQMLNDNAEGTDQMRSMFDWLAGKETQYQISDCEWQGIATQCAVSITDGCIAVSGAADGLHGKMTFYSLEDGTLRQVNVAPTAVERKAYQTWLEAETVWASEAHADELAQTEGYSRAAGEMAVQLCREYATAQK
jgi:ketosteroid isomerase-like protein